MERETEAALSQMVLAAEDMQTFGMGAVLIRPDLSAMVIPLEEISGYVPGPVYGRGKPYPHPLTGAARPLPVLSPTSATEIRLRMEEGRRKMLMASTAIRP